MTRGLRKDQFLFWEPHNRWSKSWDLKGLFSCKVHFPSIPPTYSMSYLPSTKFPLMWVSTSSFTLGFTHVGLFLPLSLGSSHVCTGTAFLKFGEKFCLIEIFPPVTTKLFAVLLLANVPNKGRYLFSSNPFYVAPKAPSILKQLF